MHSESPIGIYDSGVGGLSVLRAIRDALPHESLLYVADSAHVPYGEKTQEYVERRAAALTRLLRVAPGQGHGGGVQHRHRGGHRAAAPAPSNWSSPAWAPPSKPAAHLTHSGVVGVFATTGTLASPKFAALVRREAPEVRILFKPCPEWVRLVERGVLDGPEAEAAVRAPVAELRAAGADVLVLGCTHFPFLRDAIEAAAGPGVPLLETGAPVARRLRHQLQERALLRADGPGSLRLETSGDAAALGELASRLLGQALEADTLPERWR